MDIYSFNLKLTCLLIFIISSACCYNQEEFVLPTHTELHEPCVAIMQEFVRSNSKFISYAGLTAEPFELCLGNEHHDTFESFHNATVSFDKLVNDRDPKNNKTCASEYLNLNRMNVYVNLMENSKKIWQSAFCDDCYENSALSKNRSNDAISFLAYSEQLNTCIINNSDSVCQSCDNKYNLINKLYEQMKKVKRNKICFDLEDKMNKTRVEWSVKYFCCHNKKDDLTAFIALATTMTAILIAFYGTVYAVGMRNQPTNVLDEQEASSDLTVEGDDSILGTNEAGTSGPSSSSINRNSKNKANKTKKLVINTDSDDDVMLDNTSQSIKNDLITLDENE
ncbi:unnamed protein product [Diamesa tonsa]